MRSAMKKMVVAVMAVSFFLVQGSAEETVNLKSEQDRRNYAVGVDFVRTLKQRGGEVNLDIVVQGMRDGLTEYHLLMTDDEIRLATANQAVRIPKQKQAEIARIDGNARQKKTAVPAGNGGTVAQTLSAATGTNEEPKTAERSVQIGSFSPGNAVPSLAERGRARNEIKRRGLEQRQKTMAQERGGG